MSTNHLPTKRHDILPWMKNRQRRLKAITNPTEQQLARMEQLKAQIDQLRKLRWRAGK